MKNVDVDIENLQELARRVEKVAGSLEINITKKIVNKAGWLAVKQLAPRIRGFMISNYEQSGVGKGENSTGHMRDAINRVDVIFVGDGAPRISILLPAGMPDYTNGKKSTSFYKVASAQNYGSVRKAGGGKWEFVSRNQRSSIKKRAVGKAEPSSGTYTFTTGSGKNKVSTSHVILPKHCFDLNSMQKTWATNEFARLFNQFLSDELSSSLQSA
jgi:hypothetical protein